MKTKSFDEYLAKRLDKSEINELKQQAKLEYEVLRNLQDEISLAISIYMTERKIGFNEMVKCLHMSPTQVAKIQRGEANLTLATLAHIAALLRKCPHIVFESC
jgi:transcriptional regulator with XRE-family HTH domain